MGRARVDRGRIERGWREGGGAGERVERSRGREAGRREGERVERGWRWWRERERG